jgi:hypothetical protein
LPVLLRDVHELKDWQVELEKGYYFCRMEKVCNNCGTLVTTAYCSKCGQKASVGRLNMHALLHEWWHALTHTDKGVLLLVDELAYTPKVPYLAYFNGARKRYFSPVVFFLVTFGIFIYLDQKIFDYEDYIRSAANGPHYNEFGRRYHLLSKYIALSWLPFQALLSWLFFFRQRNLAECITFWLYFMGFVNVVWIVATPVRLLLIDYKLMTDYVIDLFTYFIMLVHAWKVFGTSIVNKLLVVLLVFVLALINIYISIFYIIHADIPASYPGLWDAVKEIVLP